VSRRLALRLLAVWLVSTLVLTLYPFAPLGPARAFWWPDVFSRGLAVDVAANVLFFVPLGVLAVAAGRQAREATLAAVLLSLLVEVAQSRIPLRVPSFLDVGANALGAAAGALGAVPLTRLAERVYHGPGRLLCLVLGAALTLAVARHFPALADFSFLPPFATAVLLALAASGVWGSRLGFAAALGTALAVWPLHAAVLVAAAAGTALGAWPSRSRTEVSIPAPAAD